jgi:hypothetical protein
VVVISADGLATVAVANAWLNTLRNSTSGLPFAAVYAELHTGIPGSAGTSNTSVGSTTRLAVTFSAASGGSIALSGTVGPWTNGGTSETLTDIALWSAATSGTFYISLPLTVSKAWASGDTFTLNTCGLSLTPLAA